jgi:hypothetical protein
MKVYVIVGLDKSGNIDSAGGFASKSDAYKYLFDNDLGKKIPKVAILPVNIKERSDEVTEATGHMQSSPELVAKVV